MNFEKLKETARKYEQKEEWRRAIEVYLQAIREFEAGNDPVPDLSVYNRIGDLYLKATEPALAVQAYERAADLYGEQGFYNNAIALCGKILRVNPGRIQTYLKLAHLHARKNVVIEAKKNLLEYLERMNAMNQLDDAFKALKDFADQFPGNKDIRLMLSELLRASSRNAEAKEQLEKLANDLEARGDTAGARKTLMRLQALESGEGGGNASPSPDASKAPAGAPRRGGNDLIFLDTGADIPRMPGKPSGPPITRKTRAVTAVPEVAPPPPAEPEAPAAELLIQTDTVLDVQPESIIEPIAPGADLPSVVIDDSPLQIETASLTDTPLDLESLQPISDEALVELSGASDVPQALGFEPTELDTAAGADVAPLEGLELDAPASEPVDLQVSSEGLDLERASLDPGELEPGERSSIIVPEPVEAPEPDALEPEPALAAEEVTGDVELYDADGNELDPLPPEPEFISLGTDSSDELGLLEPPIDEPVAAELLVEEPHAPEEEAVEFVSLDEEEEGVVLVPDEELAPAALPRLSAPDVSIEEPAPSSGPSISDLEDRVLDDPDDPEAHRALGEALLAEGDQIRGQEELELALAGYEQREDWIHAGDLINELIRLDPNGVRYHQKRVEIGFRSGDRSRLIDSYLELADALLRVGAMDKALAVYRRVAEHDPGNQRAHAALDALSGPEDDMPMIPLPAAEPPRAAAPAVDDRGRHKSAPVTKVRDEPAGGDFIDLGALVMDDEAVKDTRMQVDSEVQTGDEEKDFKDMLSAFKRGIDENIDAEDYQAHYDLGVAFKEMGLLDEAIAEFQKALRSPEGRLKTSEALGTSFYEKGQFAIAEAILKRAVESLGATDDEQIGLIYWLARSQEEQHKTDAAIANFERVLAVDIGFADVSARIGRLSAGRGK